MTTGAGTAAPPAIVEDLEGILGQVCLLLDLALRGSEESAAGAESGGASSVITDRLIGRARWEVVGTASGETWLRRVGRAETEALERGVAVRKLCTPDMLSGDTRACLEEIHRAGARIRVSPARLPEMVMIDGRVAVVRTSRRDRRGFVLRVPAILRGFHDLFASTWESATVPAAFQQHTGLHNAMTRRVLETLAAGHTDGQAARELELSVRTYRRHVATILQGLRASSRFEAGVRAAELGLIRSVSAVDAHGDAAARS